MVWLGKDAPNDEKKDAFAIGTKFLASKKLKDDTEIEVGNKLCMLANPRLKYL